jgi:hypothetical protein
MSNHINGSIAALALALSSNVGAETVLGYSTYLGGSSADNGRSVAVDNEGAVYVMGYTGSRDFPSQQPTPGRGSTLYTYIAKFREGLLEAVAYRTNTSDSNFVIDSNFIYIAGALEGNCAITKLDLNLNYLDIFVWGGSGSDFCRDVAVDTNGGIYVTGATYSDDFPVTPGAPQLNFGWLQQPDPEWGDTAPDAFVVKFNPDGSIAYSTYLGGMYEDDGFGIAVDAQGSAYVTGIAWSPDFPLTDGAFKSGDPGVGIFVTKINPQGTDWVYSSFILGNQADGIYPIETGGGIVVDAQGRATVAGNAGKGLPVTALNHNPSQWGGFIYKLNPQGSGLVYSSFLGGFWIRSLAQAQERAYITGVATPEFPLQSLSNGNLAFAVLNPEGTELIHSARFGGDIDPERTIGSAEGMALSGNSAYITGWTYSTDFPVTPDAFQPSFGGGTDAFLVRLDLQKRAGVTRPPRSERPIGRVPPRSAR